METDEFQWPDSPPRDWWEAEGASLRMSPENIRFAAAKHQLGGLDGKKNTVAMKLAGIEGGRTRAYRTARLTGVVTLLKRAAEIRTGKRPRVTEAEIDEKIDELIRSRDPQSISRGLELRLKRQAAASAVASPTTAEEVFCFLLGGSDNLNWPPLWGGEYALLRVVAAWALLGPMYVKEFGPHIVRAFPDVARAMQPVSH
jgi:hypothetical protein